MKWNYQKQERLRELLRDLENTVINGGMVTANPQGSDTVRRTMKGVLAHLTSNVFGVGDSGFPSAPRWTKKKLIMSCDVSGKTAMAVSIRLWSVVSRSAKSIRFCRRYAGLPLRIRRIVTGLRRTKAISACAES